MEDLGALGKPPSYPVLEILRRQGRAAALASAAAVFLVTVGSSDKCGPGSILRGLCLAAMTGLAVQNLAEINEIVADTLLPQ
jgi:hypothetical protein